MRLRIVIGILSSVMLLGSVQAGAAITAGSSVSAGTTTNPTTASIDTTGANLIVCGTANSGSGAVPTVTDSKSNTYTGLTATIGAASSVRIRLYYVLNPTVGTGHTFTASATGTTFLSIACQAYNGVKTTSAFDVENGAAGSGLSIQPGSATPSEDNELFVTAYSTTEQPMVTVTINSSFTKEIDRVGSGGNHFAIGLAYKIQTTGGAENPTWSWASPSAGAAVARIATFKAEPAAALRRPQAPMVFP
jgi:hypothetical protein